MRHLAVVVLHEHGAGLVDTGRALRIADVTAQPGGLAAPVHVLVGFPHIGAATGKAEGLEAHGFERDVARENQQVGPRNLVAVLLLDRPQQAACLVQAHVVGPAVERRKALLATTSTAASVADAVGARAVPGHANEQRAVVAEVGRPPVLRVGHQGGEVFLQRGQIEALEGGGVVEVLVHRIGFRRVLMQQVDAQLLGPPVLVRGAGTRGLAEGTLGFGLVTAHGENSCFLLRGDESNSLTEGAVRRIEAFNSSDSARRRCRPFAVRSSPPGLGLYSPIACRWAIDLHASRREVTEGKYFSAVLMKYAP